MCDDYRRRYRRARQLGYEGVADRFERDEKNDYQFCRNMLANGWTKETVGEIDRIPIAPGQPAPKSGQGRNWLARAQHEGCYACVDGHGAEPEEPRNLQEVPGYVHDRNARRRAETALALGRNPSPGRGATGYKGGKGKEAAKGDGTGGKGLLLAMTSSIFKRLEVTAANVLQAESTLTCALFISVS